MADIVTPEQRSRNMSAIHSRDTKPEIYFRKLLFSQGFRYRIADKRISGHPDIYLPHYHTAIFIHGCFWHRHPECKYAYTPKSRPDFWQKKFSDNIRRDQVVKDTLQEQKVRQLIVWECTIRKMQKNPSVENRILDTTIQFLRNQDCFLEL